MRTFALLLVAGSQLTSTTLCWALLDHLIGDRCQTIH